MAAQSSTRKNIIEWSQHFHRGKVLPEIQMLAQQNMSVMDMPFVECNDGTTHLYNLQTALPTVSKTMWGEGTPESKSQKAQERETCTMLTGFSTVEAEMAKVGGSEGMVRAQEDMNFAEAMKQTFASMQFYANRASNPRDFNGFATRYNSTTGVKSANVLSCSDGSPATDQQTSAYLVNWGPDVYGIFPEGTTAGYQKKDLGIQVKTLANGNQLVVKQTQHLWHVGLVVEAWQSVVRVCNIDVPDAGVLGSNQAPTTFTNVLHKMIQARLRIRRPGNKVWYVNDTVYGLLMRLALEKSASALSVQQAVTQFGEFEELRILGTPVRRVDQILNTEAAI
jgi:hypothetical protein